MTRTLCLILVGLFLSCPALADEVIRAQIVAHDRVILSSQIGSIVSALKVREGDSFALGDVLIDLDCRSYRAHLSQNVAAERLAQAILQNTQSLARLESASVQEVDKAKAEMDMSTQAKVLAQLDVERCSVRAPFAGAVVSLDVGKGEYVGPGKPLMEIVGTDNLEVHFLLPSTQSKEVQPGQTFAMDVHEIGTTVHGTIRQIAAVADPLNRTIKILGQLDGENKMVKPGMSGTVTLEDVPEQAFSEEIKTEPTNE